MSIGKRCYRLWKFVFTIVMLITLISCAKQQEFVALEVGLSVSPPRPGLNHVTVTGRCVGVDGLAIPGARVVLLSHAGLVRVDEGVCAADGRFALEDVCADGEVYLWAQMQASPDAGWWVPPCDGSVIDLGDLRALPGRDVDAGGNQFYIEGRLTTAGGKPVEGAELIVHGDDGSHDPWATGITDPDGRFSFPVCLSVLDYFDVVQGGTVLATIDHRERAGFRWIQGRQAEADLKQYLDITLVDLRPVSLHVTGNQDVLLSRKMLSGWYGLVSTERIDYVDGPHSYRALAPGWLPQIASIGPEESSVMFDFVSPTAPNYCLSVQDDRGPVSGAMIECFADGDNVASLSTDASGGLELKGRQDRSWQVRVSAEGHVTQRISWSPHAPLSVRLRRLSAPVQLPDLSIGERLSIYLPGQSRPVAIRSGPALGEQIRLPATELEAVFSKTDSGTVLRSCSFTTLEGKVVTIPDVDDRASITLHLPDSPVGKPWTVECFEYMPDCSHEIPRAVSGGRYPISAFPGAEVRQINSKQFRILVTRSQRLVTLMGFSGSRDWVMRERIIRLGSKAIWRIPTLSAALEGAMAEMDHEQSPYGGHCGPRLLLRALDPEGFDRLTYLPRRVSSQSYKIAHVHVGSYAVFSHLKGEEDTCNLKGDGIRSRRQWGGIAVRVASSTQTTQIELPDHEGYQRIRIVRASGAPVWAATVSLRDPMHEARCQTIATGRVSSGDMELPEPPMARTDRQGCVSLGPILDGWIELVVVLQDGSVFSGRLRSNLKNEIVIRLL